MPTAPTGIRTRYPSKQAVASMQIEFLRYTILDHMEKLGACVCTSAD